MGVEPIEVVTDSKFPARLLLSYSGCEVFDAAVPFVDAENARAAKIFILAVQAA